MKSIALLVSFVTSLTLLGCGVRVKTVTLEKVRTEWRDRVRVDSVYFRDSIHESEKTVNDTVYKVKEGIRWRDRSIHDTVQVVKTDTISVPVEVVKEVPRPFFAEFKSTAGWIIGVIVAVTMFLGILRYILRFHH